MLEKELGSLCMMLSIHLNFTIYLKVEMEQAQGNIILCMEEHGEKNPMYGVHRYGENAPMYGHQHSEETRRKMRENHADQSGEKNPRYGYHYTEEEKRKSSIAHSKLTENQVLEIVELRKQGFQYKELAEKFGVSKQTISNICCGKRYSLITGIKYGE